MAGEFLVPLLRTEGGCPDPIAIETWHLALGPAVAVEVPHDLFALWLFPATGGVVLLGPEALAADRVEVPVPAQVLQQDDLYRLEETLRRAKYLSAIAAPIRHAGRDVGVMLLGSLSQGALGPAQAVALRRLGAQLAPTMADLAAKMHSVSPHPLLEPDLTRETLPEHLARVVCEVVSGPDLVSRTSGILYPLLPHDRLEILVPGTISGSLVGLSGSPTRRRWSGAGGPGAAELLGTIVARFGESPTLLLADLGELGAGVEWHGGSHSLPVRSLLGARLAVGGRTAGYVLLGSVARDAYRPEDEDTLALAALLLAPRAAALRAPGETTPESASPSEPEEPPIRRAAAVLADTAHLEEGLRGFARELGRLLPHHRISIHLRRGEGEVISLDPNAPRPFADLPGIPVGAFEGAELLRDEREWLALTTHQGDEVLVPLRVAGRTVGTFAVGNPDFPSSRQAAAIARQFADVLAPHLELLRRGGAASGSGWRTSVVGPRPVA